MSKEGANGTFVGEDLNSVARIVFIVVGVIEVISGVFGNLLLLVSMLRQRSLRLPYVHYMFIANLALADLLSEGYWMTFFVLDLLFGYHPIRNEAHCVANGFIVGTCLGVSVISLMSISLNRYLNICHHRLFKRVVTTLRTAVCCVLTWIISLGFSTPLLVGIGKFSYNPRSHICSFDKKEPISYPLIIVLSLALLLSCCVGYCNYAIFRHWKSARSRDKNDNPIAVLYIWNSETNIGKQTDKSQTENEPNESSFFNGCKYRTEVDMQEDINPQLPNGAKHLRCEPLRNSAPSVLPGELRRLRELRHDNRLSEPICFVSADQIRTQSTSPRQSTNNRPRPMSSWGLGQARRSHERLAKGRASELLTMERSFIRSLLVTFVITLAACIPFFVINLVSAKVSLPPEILIMGNLLLFASSSVNWIIYGAMNPSFRIVFPVCMCRIMTRCLRERAEHPADTVSSGTLLSNAGGSAQNYESDMEFQNF